MSDIADKLYQTELIKQLKARYFRGLDTKDWELFGSTMTEDCAASYSDGKLPFEGREAIVNFMIENLSAVDTITMHNGHHPEIELSADGEHATGIWYLQDKVILMSMKTMLNGAGIYRDEYVKIDGNWIISKTGYNRTFEAVQPIGDDFQLTANMFAAVD